jgi:diguanylate cyclase (GGDEF)-like protein
MLPSGFAPRRRTVVLALEGALLGLGAPLGWIAVEWMRGRPPLATIGAEPMLIVYLLSTTTLAFVLFGWLAGAREQRLLEATRRLDELTITDALTGLRNRRYFMERLEQALALAERGAEPVSIALVDLDRFKRINDGAGHWTGDEALRAAAAAMTAVVRRGEVVARVGGDELAVLLPCADRIQGQRAAERVRAAIAGARVRSDGGPIRLTASVGVACSSDIDRPTVRRLYSAADAALYRAKDLGRDRVVAYDPLAGPWSRPSAITVARPRGRDGRARTARDRARGG